MKLTLFAAALAVSTGAIAQEAPSQPSTPAAARTFTDANGFQGEETRGGYQPAGSPYSSPPAQGQQVLFRAQTLTPSQAFPPPPPRAYYPLCKPKQYDGCRQRR